MNENGRTKDMFWTDYQYELARSIKQDPAAYFIKDAAVVTEKMRASVDGVGRGNGTLGSVNIDSVTFRRLAKKYGIKNTYKAWNDFYRNLR